MGKAGAFPHYEDFRMGNRIDCAGPRAIGHADRSAWIGLTGDPTPRFGMGKAVHPLIVFATAMGQVATEVHGHCTEELGVSNLVAHRPVLTGTTLRTTARVVGVREDPDRSTGVVWVRVASRDDRGVLLSFVHWFRVTKKHKQSNTQRDSLPSQQTEVSTTELHTRELDPIAAHESGGRFTFEDYVDHERIHHRGPSNLLLGDITRFARQFRHRDPRHHDAQHPHYAAPTALVVGIAYALAHDGLENRLGLGAVNALRTPNRIQDGDRLYAMTQVAATQQLNDDFGAVRGRLYLFRNRDPSIEQRPVITEGKRYHPQVALDMDFWEILPTQKRLR